jgi:phospholipid transport system substrate-binding protein
MDVRRAMTAFLALMLLAPVPLEAAGGPAATDPLGFVKQRYDDLQAVVKKYPEKARMQQGIRDVMEIFVDYPELSRRTLADQWAKLTKKQQADFVAEFKKMIQRSYVKRFDPGKEFTIDYTGQTRTDAEGAVTVPSTIRSGRSEAKVEYVLRTVAGKWMAFDVVIDDVSMIRNYRKQFHDIMEKSGYTGLMERLRKKNTTAQE